jgi:hypothetical protein
MEHRKTSFRFAGCNWILRPRAAGAMALAESYDRSQDSAVDAISLADGTVTTNGFPDELCKTIHEILILQQLARRCPRNTRARRTRELADKNRCIHQRCRHG